MHITVHSGSLSGPGLQLSTCPHPPKAPFLAAPRIYVKVEILCYFMLVHQN